MEWQQGEGDEPSEDDMEYNAMYHGQYRLKIGSKWFDDLNLIELASRNSDIQRVQEVQNWDLKDVRADKLCSVAFFPLRVKGEQVCVKIFTQVPTTEYEHH